MKLLKFAFYSVGAVFGAIVLWLTVGGAIAENMLDNARSEWERENGSLASFYQRHPRTEKNEAARTLEVLASSIGLNIRPRGEGEVIAEDHPLALEFKTASAGLNDYVSTQVEKSGGPIDPVPTNLASFIRTHRKKLISIENHLTSGQLPAWRFDGEYDAAMEFPNLLGHMRLARLMSTHALLALEEKSHTEAWHALHAVRRLGDSLQPHPVLISQLISMAIGKQQALLARHMPSPVPAWQLAAPHRDRRRDLIDALVVEQLFVDTGARSATLVASATGSPSRLRDLLTQPFTTACAANLWKVNRNVIAELERKDLCTIDPDAFSRAHFASIPSWNMVGRGYFFPDYASTLVRLRESEMTDEMTRKVLEAKMSRLASAGVWPQAVDGIEKSRCAEKNWQYAVAPDGTMTLSLANPWKRDASSPSKVPFTYSER